MNAGSIDVSANLLNSLYSQTRVSGLTHSFYRYPARFPPQYARAAILSLTSENDLVLDAFMGGGTTIVEAVANNRNAIGFDVNPLSRFITKVKTTPLSTKDKQKVIEWVAGTDLGKPVDPSITSSIVSLKHIPSPLGNAFINLNNATRSLESPRQRDFARCVMLRFGQWAVDCRSDLPEESTLKEHLAEHAHKMMVGMDELVSEARDSGVRKNHITSKRQLYLGSIDNLTKGIGLDRLFSKVRLVLTSPPYPGVHVLYHRWQVNSRRETSAPFWLAGLRDGHSASHYTLGSRSQAGLRKYFTRIAEIFKSIRPFIHPDGLVVQLVAFPEPETQLPAFLRSMTLAGYEELSLLTAAGSKRPSRVVPRRKWYTNTANPQHSAEEILLLHRPTK